METNVPKATEVPVRHLVPSPRPAKAKELNEPCLVDEANVKKWTSDMLKGHPGGRATTWEQWGNSFANQFKEVVDPMAHSLRIKEDSDCKTFAEKEKVVKLLGCP